MTISIADTNRLSSVVISSPVDFSVAICTYNGADRLSRVLDHLQVQTKTEGINWEILIVDNNSSDQTAAVIREHQSAWYNKVPLRYCFEPKQGVAFARQRAVEEAQGTLIGFLDDDNLPQPDWVAQAFAFAQKRPDVGAYGSRIFGEFETSPPENFHRIAPLLALTDRGNEALFYHPHKKLLPPGAGLVIRKQAWLDNVPQSCFLQGRVAGCQLPGEDLEALLHIQGAGWEIWYNPEMTMTHCIPYWRLTPEYLLRLCQQIGLSRFHTRMLSIHKWLRPIAAFAYMGNDLRKIIRHLIKYKDSLRNDIIALCELRLYIYSLLSPFYLFKEYLKPHSS